MLTQHLCYERIFKRFKDRNIQVTVKDEKLCKPNSHLGPKNLPLLLEKLDKRLSTN